ncbi:hypothetical protein P4571_08205 [Niallia alba]|uniref:hypothetical protein n=1 Tax=Niallia alba TaxID=2729105 RepID=UPI002E2393B7|nr:hypothetical protein [Niallia alba]
MGEVYNINKLKVEKMYKDFYKNGGIDLRLDNVKRTDNVVAIRSEGNVIGILRNAR